jgi:hypothetical protein
VFPGKTRQAQREVTRLKQTRAIKAIGPRLYIRTGTRDIPRVVREQWARVVSTLFPDALISHRTAIEYEPTDGGDVFLTAKTRRVVSYPGLNLRFDRGPTARADDPRFMGMQASSLPRALLENLSTTRGSSKTLPRADLEARLEQILRDGGEAQLNEVRDAARRIADDFGWRREMERLDALVGALPMKSELGRARAAGQPYDQRCLERLQLLFGELRRRSLPALKEPRGFGEHYVNKAFFEAYFSNYIEGTDFELSEAEKIVHDGAIPPRRPKDAHDILSTYRIVSDPNEMRRIPSDDATVESLLVARHATLMAARPEVGPGRFKDRQNRAGDTLFVHPDYVAGTLARGAELLRDLAPGIERAIFVMFLVADVHPFIDGNGRIARIMMNAELVAARSPTIIIPTVYRDEYIDTLRALSRQHRPAPVVDMLLKAQKFSNLDFTDYPKIRKELEDRNWFKEPDSAFRLIV